MTHVLISQRTRELDEIKYILFKCIDEESDTFYFHEVRSIITNDAGILYMIDR